MRVEFVNPFIDAARNVLEAEVAAQVTRGQLSLHTSAYTTLPVTVMIAVTGRVQGIVLYGMSEETALAIVSTVVGQPFTELNEMAQSGIAEMGNVITGLASSVLSDSGYVAKIAPPTLLIGHGVMISTLGIHRLVVPLETQYGTIEVQVALREAPTNGKAEVAAATTHRMT